MATVLIIEFDDFDNVVSETESEIHEFESASEMLAYLDDSISEYDAEHGIDDSDFDTEFAAYVEAHAYHGGSA